MGTGILDGKKAGLPDVAGRRPFEDFIAIAVTIAPGFNDYWRNRIMDDFPDDLSFFQFIQNPYQLSKQHEVNDFEIFHVSILHTSRGVRVS
jgi:hypothetical protein